MAVVEWRVTIMSQCSSVSMCVCVCVITDSTVVGSSIVDLSSLWQDWTPVDCKEGKCENWRSQLAATELPALHGSTHAGQQGSCRLELWHAVWAVPHEPSTAPYDGGAAPHDDGRTAPHDGDAGRHDDGRSASHDDGDTAHGHAAKTLHGKCKSFCHHLKVMGFNWHVGGGLQLECIGWASTGEYRVVFNWRV